MSLSVSNPLRRRHLAPPTHWQPFRPVLPQALIAAGLGGAALLLALFALPGLSNAMIGYYVTFLHEASHALFGYFVSGEVGKISLHADGGGKTLVETGSSIGAVLTAGSGLVVPAWLGATLLLSAATRVGIELFLFALALLTAWLGFHYVDAEGAIPLVLVDRI